MNHVKRANTMRTESAYASPIRRTLARLLAIAAALFLTGLLLPAMSLAQSVSPGPAKSSLIVKLAPGLSGNAHAAVIARNGGAKASSIPALGLDVIEVPTHLLEQVRANYRAHPQVVRAEENLTRQIRQIRQAREPLA